jgi:hypothetical protein
MPREPLWRFQARPDRSRTALIAANLYADAQGPLEALRGLDHHLSQNS